MGEKRKFCVSLTTLNKSVIPYHTKFLILTALGLLTGVITSYGQEEQFPGSSEQEERSESNESDPMEAGIQIWDNDQDLQSRPSIDKPTQPTIRPTTPAGSEKKDKALQGKEDESVLSFNFLYYIIQKFKLSESVE